MGRVVIDGIADSIGMAEFTYQALPRTAGNFTRTLDFEENARYGPTLSSEAIILVPVELMTDSVCGSGCIQERRICVADGAMYWCYMLCLIYMV